MVSWLEQFYLIRSSMFHNGWIFRINPGGRNPKVAIFKRRTIVRGDRFKRMTFYSFSNSPTGSLTTLCSICISLYQLARRKILSPLLYTCILISLFYSLLKGILKIYIFLFCVSRCKSRIIRLQIFIEIIY